MSKSMLKPRIYTIATAHLDTTWHWTLEETVRDYLPDTCEKNFALFEKHPQYVFNFEGAYRYELIKEYYPAYFEKIREYAKEGRWYPAGSAYENGDTNIPSPEALIRNILYGCDFFKKEFGTDGKELFLPDCFGFSYVLPSVARHAGLMGFSTQKLPRAGGYGIPFDIGKWYGVDGSFIYAALDNFNYGFSFKKSVRGYHHAKAKLTENTNRFGIPFASLYHGTGDKGGSPKEQSVAAVCREAEENSEHKVSVIPAKACDLFCDLDRLPEELKGRLPEYRNELIATDHGAGCYTARTFGKRMNRRAEQLLFSAEALANAARLSGALNYPEESFNSSWKTVIAHQFHDDITGTGAMECSERAWNDYAIVHAEAAAEIHAAASALSKGLDTAFCKGTPLAVVSAAGAPGRRTESITVLIKCKEGETAYELFDKDGTPVPLGTAFSDDGCCKVTFTADVPSCGLTVYDLVPCESAPCDCLTATEHKLENEKLRVLIDGNGDICSVYSKELGFEALSAPIRYNLVDFNGSVHYPAWELDYRETVHAPAGYPTVPEITVLKQSPARAAVRVTREYKGSRFTEVISLSRGSGRCDVSCEIDWRSFRSLLKVAFPLSAANSKASYDLGLGYISRPNSTKRVYEFPAQNWADITARNGSFGVSVLSDSRCGWDKPSDNTLRLTAVFSPKASRGESSSQQLLDFGLNRFSYSILPHRGDDLCPTQREGMFFNSPLYAFTADRHTGSSREAAFCELSPESVLLRSCKKALNSDATVIRVNEGAGKPVTGAALSLPEGVKITRAYEADGRENIIGDAHTEGGKLIFDMTPFSVKTFLIYTENGGIPESTAPVPFEKDICAFSAEGENTAGIFPEGLSIPKELIPQSLRCREALFYLDADGMCVRANKQSITLPDGTKSVHLLLGSTAGDREAIFSSGGVKSTVTVPAMLERFGTWDLLAEKKTGYIKKGSPAFKFTHMHSPGGNVHCKYCTLFSIELPAGDDPALILPDDNKLLVFAVSASAEPLSCKSAVNLCESIPSRECDFVYSDGERKMSVPGKRDSRRARRRSNACYVRIRIKRELSQFKRK